MAIVRRGQTNLCQCFTIAGRNAEDLAYCKIQDLCIQIDFISLPSVESTIVPSKSERRPSKVTTCGGAENEPWPLVIVLID